MSNTGEYKVAKLIEVNSITGLPTGNSKPNLPSDPDYIEPVTDYDRCPIIPTTTTTTTVGTTTTTTAPTTTTTTTSTTTTTTEEPTTTTTTTEAPFSINSSVSSEGAGVLDIIGGEPGEQIDLTFDMDPVIGTFNSLNFGSPVTVSVLDNAHLNRTGFMILDGSGNGSSIYTYDPTTATKPCLVTVVARSSGLTPGIGDDTNVV